jgi:hypothetical protein
MKARDRVTLCIEQARNHSGETALRALTNAVEILADQLKDEHVGTYHPPMIAEIKTQDEPGARTHDSAPNATPAPNLVERLKKAYVFAEMEAIAGGGDPVDLGVRAILTSLSKTPVAMMTADHIATLCGGEDYSPTDRRYARVAVQAFKEFVAPILAAKDARIEKLEALYAAAKVTDPERIETIELQRKRIVELEKQRDDECGLSNLRSFEIDTWKKELAEARAKIAELESSHVATVEAMQAALNMAKRDYMATQTALDATKDKLQRTEQDLGAKLDRISELEKRIAELTTPVTADGGKMHPSTLAFVRRQIDNLDGHGEPDDTREVGGPWIHKKDALRVIDEILVVARREHEQQPAIQSPPMTVDGKTPGQVANEGYERAAGSRTESWEAAANAVLRAFGQPNQTTQTNAAEVLGKLASYWEKGAAYDGMPEQYRRGLKDCAKELREELAKLRSGPSQTQQDAVAALLRVHSAIKHSLSLLPYNTSFMNGVAVVRKDNVEKNVQRTFDAEIAKLGTEPPSKATTPTFFVNENGLRGSYFCTQFPFRPFLHIGHDIEFDDIPRILKLGRNDIIEVRVVERAKQ